MTISKQVLTALSVGGSVLALAACGGTSRSAETANSTAGSGQTPASNTVSSSGPVRIEHGGMSVTGEGPVDTIIAIDRTTLLHADPPLADSYKTTALQAAEPTIQRGGSLTILVFGRIASKALDVYSIRIPTLEQDGPAARDDAGQTDTVAAALDVAIGLKKPPSSSAAEALAQVTYPEGSDIGAIIGDSIEQLAQSKSSIRDVVVLTDGYVVRDGQPPLWTMLKHRRTIAAARQIVRNAAVPSHTRPITLLWVAGLGTTAGKVGGGATSVEDLQKAYSLACNELPVQQCSASAEA